MLGVIKNELFKFFHQKKSLYVLLIFLSFICLLLFLEICQGDSNFNDIQALPFSVIRLSMFMMLIPIFTTIITVNMIKGERESGTFKLPLLYKISRLELIIAKVLSLLIIFILILTIIICFSYLLAYFMGWGEGFSLKIISTGNVSTQSYTSHEGIQSSTSESNLVKNHYFSTSEGILLTIKFYFTVLCNMMIWAMFVLCLSLNIKKKSTIFVISIGIIVVINFVSIIFSKPSLYIFNTLWNIHFEYLINNIEFSTLFRAIIVQCIYGILLFVLSLWTFKNKDIFT